MRWKDPPLLNDMSEVTRYLLACLHLLLVRPFACSGAVLNPPLELPSSNASLIFVNDSRQFRARFGDRSIWRHCATPDKWWNPVFSSADCTGAVDWLSWEEKRGDCTRSCEFRSPGASKKTHQKPQRTPRKYTFSKPPFQSLEDKI